MAYERFCKLCGVKYSYCPYCDDFKNEPKWKTMFHNENCFTIFNALQRHFLKEFSDEEAINILENCDLSVLSGSTESIKNSVSSILNKKKIETQESSPVVVGKVSTPKKKQRSIKAKTNNDKE